MGKSTAMKHIAVSWADGTSEDLEKFQLVFHISLKHVKDNSPLECIIIAQHSGLKANKVQPTEIKSILDDGDRKVLLLIDGHDEYRTGRNNDIDAAIKKESLWNCWVILTSRETEQIKEIKEYMDAEAEIEGFDEKNIKVYITQSLNNENLCTQFLKQAAKNDLCIVGANKEFDWYSDLLKIPIILNMMCVLFLCNVQTLAKSKGRVVRDIVDRCIDRESIRAKGQKAIDSAKRTLFNLGKLAWQGLNGRDKKLIFEKVFALLF